MTREAFLARSNLWSGVVIGAGVLTIVGGVGVALRRHWGLYVIVAAALVVRAFPLMSQILLLKSYAFDFDLVDVGIAAVIGLGASLA
jgi:hypothetical protein